MKELLVGYAQKDITPDFPVGLSGYGNDTKRLHRQVLDPISGSCLALSDGTGEMVILYSVDLLLVTAELTTMLRCAVSEATGIGKDRIFLAATHNHSGPSVGDLQIPWAATYCEMFIERMTLAAREAVADCSAAKMMVGKTSADGLNYTRHYINEDGSYFGDNFGTQGQIIAGHAGEPDRQLQMVRFVREDKKDILLVNWQAHAKMCSTATSLFGKEHHYDLSADFIGYARDCLRQQTGAEVIYFSGASGNLNPDSRIPEEAPPKEPDRVGALLASAAAEALGQMTEVRDGQLFCKWETVTVSVDHSDDDKVPLAREIWSLWPTDPQGCKVLAKEKGFCSAYATRDVLRRAESGESRQLELGVVTLGDLAFVAVPYEMFCDNGKYIKEKAPFSVTVIMSCTNEYHKYIPSEFAFSHGCYEVDSRIYPRGTAEQLAEKLVKMLNEQAICYQ